MFHWVGLILPLKRSIFIYLFHWSYRYFPINLKVQLFSQPSSEFIEVMVEEDFECFNFEQPSLYMEQPEQVY